jgi:NAD(P)-dependent dehydrogenase (short-subunit alcohol dehydrogenase family)
MALLLPRPGGRIRTWPPGCHGHRPAGRSTHPFGLIALDFRLAGQMPGSKSPDLAANDGKRGDHVSEPANPREDDSSRSTTASPAEKRDYDGKTVVITGASAGIGRAAAELFGSRGARVALIARGEAGLRGAASAVESLGGTALALPADVADFEAVDRAAERAEAELGPVDVWVNVAFTSVFAPFTEITPAEFRRVTEVSYLGYVHGTMAALQRMKPRDRGTIVQVGSALGYRAIPLQSAYCGAKHAVNGFTESVRTELLHDHSNVKITVVQMPAVNTPQFSWVRSRLPRHPQPVPPIYEPEVAAEAVVFAAGHPERKEYWAGGSTAATILGQKFIAPLLDRYLAHSGYDSQQTGQREEPGKPDNLWKPVDEPPGTDHGAHGEFDGKSRARSGHDTLAQVAESAGSTVTRAFGSLITTARKKRQ